MLWEYSRDSHIFIFSVGRGNAALVRTPLNQGFIVDMGSSDEFSPVKVIKSTFLRKLSKYQKCQIAQTVLSHAHADHIAECEHLRDDLSPKLVTCPNNKDYPDGSPSREKLNWKRITNPEGTGDLVDAYKDLYSSRHLPLQTIQTTGNSNAEYSLFYVRPPVCEKLHASDDNKYGNSTSLMFFYKHGLTSVLLPGDMTPEVMQHVLNQREGTETRHTKFDPKWMAQHPKSYCENSLDQPSLAGLLKANPLTILVAPHHGLESCYSPDLYSAMEGGKPELVVISEKRKLSETDGKLAAAYQTEAGASGLEVTTDGKREARRSVSTIDGRHMLIKMNGVSAPQVFADKDIGRLVNCM